MSNEETKMFLAKDGEEIELLSYNDEEITLPTLEAYTDFILEIEENIRKSRRNLSKARSKGFASSNEKLNVKILMSDFERIKSILDRKGEINENL